MLLSVDRLTKRFGKVTALSEVDLQMESGSNLALLGESGSGKSTLLQIIAGFLTPDEGEVRMNGELLCKPGYKKDAHLRKIGMIFQQYALFPHMTVEENIAFGAEKSRKKELSKAYIELTGLNELEKRYPHELSGGQMQRVAIARALAAEPSLLLLDEPFSSLDPSIKQSVRNQVTAVLQTAQTPSILVTHDIEDALCFAQKLAILEKGRLVQIGTAEELYNNPASTYIASLFGSINVLPDDGSGKIHFFRPHEASIASGNEGKFIGIVEKSVFHGRKYLTHISSEEFKFVIETDYAFTSGETVNVTPDSGKLKTTHS